MFCHLLTTQENTDISWNRHVWRGGSVFHPARAVEPVCQNTLSLSDTTHLRTVLSSQYMCQYTASDNFSSGWRTAEAACCAHKSWVNSSRRDGIERYIFSNGKIVSLLAMPRVKGGLRVLPMKFYERKDLNSELDDFYAAVCAFFFVIISWCSSTVTSYTRLTCHDSATPLSNPE